MVASASILIVGGSGTTTAATHEGSPNDPIAKPFPTHQAPTVNLRKGWREPKKVAVYQNFEKFPCRKVLAIGLRGSGQDTDTKDRNGLGVAVGAFMDEYARKVGTKNVTTVAYVGGYFAPPVPSFTDISAWLSYLDLLQPQADNFVRFLDETANETCPKSKLMLVGYSQGTMIAQMALSQVMNAVTRDPVSHDRYKKVIANYRTMVLLSTPWQDGNSEPLWPDSSPAIGLLLRLGITVDDYNLNFIAQTKNGNVIAYCYMGDILCDSGLTDPASGAAIHGEAYKSYDVRQKVYPIIANKAKRINNKKV